MVREEVDMSDSKRSALPTYIAPRNKQEMDDQLLFQINAAKVFITKEVENYPPKDSKGGDALQRIYKNRLETIQNTSYTLNQLMRSDLFPAARQDEVHELINKLASKELQMVNKYNEFKRKENAAEGAESAYFDKSASYASYPTAHRDVEKVKPDSCAPKPPAKIKR